VADTRYRVGRSSTGDRCRARLVPCGISPMGR
jgi:hypothetical protein